MPQQVISGYRSSSEGLNYEAVKKSVKGAKPVGQGQFRTIESVRREQSLRRPSKEHVRVRRRQSALDPDGNFRITKKGIFYAVATVVMIVMVKLMISFASKSGLPADLPTPGVKPMHG